MPFTPRSKKGDRDTSLPLTGMSAGVSVVSLAILIFAANRLPMTWDEGDAIARAKKIEHWFGRWSILPQSDSSEQNGPLSHEAIERDWPFLTQREGHPAGYALVIAAGVNLAEGLRLSPWLPPLTRYRFGGLLLAAVAFGAVFHRMARCFSLWAALSGVLALVLMPRLFAHLQISACDGPLVATWLLAWALFPFACRKPLGAVGWGIVLAGAMSMKFTGLLVPVPFLLWSIVFAGARWWKSRSCRSIAETAQEEKKRRSPLGESITARSLLRTWAIAVPVALATFYLLHPPMWHDPITSLQEFFHANMTREDYNIAILFLGRMYDLHHPLPWYNTLFWTAVTVPVGLGILMVAGLFHGLSRGEFRPATGLILFSAGTLLVVRSLPGAPPHDGIRLIAPAFAFLALLVGLGVDGCLRWSRCAKEREDNRRIVRHRMPRRAAGALVPLLLLLGSATSLLWYAPHWLSYYNLCIGGLPGAVRAGMEPTYYWDALDRETLDWLNRNTGPEEAVCFEVGPPKNLDLLARWGMLEVPYFPTEKERRFRFVPSTSPSATESQPSSGGYPFRWYVLQHRPSAMFPADHWLVTHRKPAYRHVLRERGWGPWRLDVPLLEVYPFSDYERAWQATREKNETAEQESGKGEDPETRLN